jgi:hypothetical protein
MMGHSTASAVRIAFAWWDGVECEMGGSGIAHRMLDAPHFAARRTTIANKFQRPSRTYRRYDLFRSRCEKYHWLGC